MEAIARNVRVIPANPMLTPTGRPRSQKERVAAYCRVSTDEKDQINSFNAQKTYYEQKINESPEWTLAGIFADEGISGTSMDKRTEFKRMLRACRQRKVDRILCKSLSRFARNTVDCLDTVRELRGLGISVYFEKENIDTLKQQGEFIITLYSSFAQAESESISANVRLGKRMSFAKGKVIFRTDMMIGYEKDEAGNPIHYTPPLGISFWSFRLMIGLGVFSAALAVWALWATRKGRVSDNRWLSRLAVIAIPMPFLACSFGWIFTEVGRQPWVVAPNPTGIDAVSLLTQRGVSTAVPAGVILASMIGFTVLYAALGVVWYRLIHRYAIEGVPDVHDESPEAREPDDDDDANRPLSFAY